MRAISEYKGASHCEGYDYKFPDKIMEAPLSETFFTKRMELLSRVDGSCWIVIWGLIFLHFRIAISVYEN